jgi:hypothetical protein
VLANVLECAGPGLRLNEHLVEEGPVVFEHACKMGLEGIVSKRKDSSYPLGPLTALGQEQEPKRTSGKAGSREGLGPHVNKRHV